MASSSDGVAASRSRPRKPTRDIPQQPSTLTVDDTSSIAPGPALVSSPISETPEDIPPPDLTPVRAHYLKKSLIQLQFNRELDAITSAAPGNVSTLSYLGPPFTPPPRDAPTLSLPFLRYIFRQFVITFPFMAAAPKDFYSEKLQPFIASVLSRNLSPTSIFDENPENSEKAVRLKLLGKVERNLSLFMSAATKLQEKEEVVRLTQVDLEKLEQEESKRMKKLMKLNHVFEVNVISVRTVADKGRVRSKAHEEFIIRTRRSHHEDRYVSRRYGDFKTLANELHKMHPEEQIPTPPAKDRTIVNVQAPLSPSPSRTESFDYSSPAAPMPAHNSRLAREKNRLTLRAYIHSLLSSSTIASSPVLQSFLLSGPTTLTPEEREDARQREEADRIRDEGRKQFAREIASRVEALRGAVKSVKGDIMGKDGLTTVFATIKVTENVRDLPQNYQAVLEWARMSLASTIFQQFVASDNASQTFASLKRIHGLMPYFMLKAALKISNPMSMIRTLLDLFLAQPFGGRSLLQRMFSGSLQEEVTILEQEIEAVKDKVEDPMLCEKIRVFVYAPREIQELYKADAESEKMNLLTIVLRSGEAPVLNRAQMQRVARAHRSHAQYMQHREQLDDSDDDDGPQDDDAWMYEDLKVLANLYSRLRDRQQLIALIFEGFTSELLKDIITIFYSPLAQVYRAASIADSIGDLQNFLNDLIRTVESTEQMAQEDPHRTVQAFISLVQRHEQSFYQFVHKVHSKGEGLFDSLMRWIELFLTVVREGLLQPISLEFLLPHTGKERSEILAEVDEVALYHYKLKLMYENKLRRRFGAPAKGSEADAEDEMTQNLLNGVAGEISFGEVIQGDANDLAAQDSDEEDDSEFDSDEDSDAGTDDTYSTTGSDETDSVDDTPRIPSTVPRSMGRASAPSSPVVARRSTQTADDQPPPPPPPKDNAIPPAGRMRTLSLRSMRSLKSLKVAAGRASTDSAPPVPPLPQGVVSPAFQKPLPPSPAFPLSSSDTMSLESRSTGGQSHLHHGATASRPPPPKPKKPKKVKQALKPPELHHIPKLLPVFTEMVHPLLRPRQRTATSRNV